MNLRFKGASANLRRVRTWDCSYYGPLDRTTSATLGRYVRGVTGFDSMLERVDKALLAIAGDFQQHELAYLKNTKPGAIVCRPDQYEEMVKFCRFVSSMGVIRVAFLDPNLAAQWVESFL